MAECKCCLITFSVCLQNYNVGFIILKNFILVIFLLMPNYVHILQMLRTARRKSIKGNYHWPNYKTKQYSFIQYLYDCISIKLFLQSNMVTSLVQSSTACIFRKFFLETTISIIILRFQCMAYCSPRNDLCFND